MVDRVRAREADIRAFIARLEKNLYKNLDNILGDIQSGSIEGAEAAQVLISLESALKKLGLNEDLQRLRIIYASERKGIIRDFNKLGFKGELFSNTDEDVVEALIKFDTDRTAANINRYLGNVRSVIMSSVLVGETPDFAEVHDNYGPKLEANLEAELNTSIAAFDRTVTVKKAQDLGLELFVYRGPDDKITRPFCDKLLNQRDPAIYTIDEIRAMNNDTGLDVITYGGGYNCRHQWSPVSYERAKQLGYKELN